jgi:hypothetical protein
MNFQSKFLKTALLSFVFIILSMTAANAQKSDEYSFKVTNNTDSTIKKLLVAEAGKKYGYFDIGKGIAPGKTVTLVWDKSTNNQACVQYFKAVYDDGSESEPAKFNFCEDELELVFDN